MTIYLVIACTEYEGSEVAFAFSDNEKAEIKKTELEDKNEAYSDNCEETDYEPTLKSPRFYFAEYFIITPMEVDHVE